MLPSDYIPDTQAFRKSDGTFAEKPAKTKLINCLYEFLRSSGLSITARILVLIVL